MDKRVDLYDVEALYAYIEGIAKQHNLKQTMMALPLMKELHKGQFRYGNDKKPYIIHPMMIARQAVALGLLDDELVAAILLHDVLEDCDVKKEELPVSDEVKKIVELVSFFEKEGVSEAEAKAAYYQKIAGHKKASILKVLDRCNNVSTMGETFPIARLCHYIEETQTYVYPLIEKILSDYPEYSDAAFLAQYQIESILRTLKRFLNNESDSAMDAGQR